MMPSPDTAAIITTNESLGTRVGRIAAALASDEFPSGDRAALKRFSPGQSLPLAYWRFWPRWLQQDAPTEAQSQDWALILAGMALMGRNANQPRLKLGAVLAEQGYSEQRLERLLAADDAPTRRQLFARATRFLAAKGAAIDWLEAVRFVLAGAELRETLVHQIARDYYATQYRLNSNKE